MWTKLDDGFLGHPKILAAGDQCELLYVRALVYSARYLTDGFISRAALASLTRAKRPEELADKLVEVGLWEDDFDEDGWRIHDYHDYNPSAEEVKRERAAARDRMKNVRANKRRTSPEQTQNFAACSDSPYPSRPDPFPYPQGGGERASRAALGAPPPPKGRKRSYEIPNDAA